jgi:hypothetical protein
VKATLFGAASLDRKTGYAKRKTIGVQWGLRSGELPVGAIVTGAVLVRVPAYGMLCLIVNNIFIS